MKTEKELPAGFRALTDKELEAVVGGMTRNEVIDCINNNWQIMPEEDRKRLIEKYVECGPAAALKLLKHYIGATQQDYLSPMLDLFR